MNVDQFVLDAAYSADLPSLRDLVHVLNETIVQIEQQGGILQDDPAVLILGSFIAFHTHSDINTVGGYKQLLDMCATRLSNAPPCH